MNYRALCARTLDPLISPAVLASAGLLRLVRRIGVEFMPTSLRIFRTVGVFPIQDHYYEPLFHPRHLNADFHKPRNLSGINWNIETQLGFLDALAPFASEAPVLPNTAFDGADAICWYCMIRLLKPKRIIEVGSGYSTRVAIKAIADSGQSTSHICIEPFEEQWLEETHAKIIRQRLEDVNRSIFHELEAGDILFIDSSHIIRPQGDVLTEVLEIVPTLAPGVVVHFHDIFSPRHYHRKWVEKEVKLWNEQYLVEAFMSHNHDWEIIAALNYLKHEHQAHLKRVFPDVTPACEPGSFYIRRVR
jgi:hypothetical protein